jgi:hypothetical protein
MGRGFAAIPLRLEDLNGEGILQITERWLPEELIDVPDVTPD